MLIFCAISVSRVSPSGNPSSALAPAPMTSTVLARNTVSLRRHSARPRHVAPPRKKPRDGDVFIQLLPVEAGAAEFDGFALGGGAVEEAGEPGEGDAERAAVLQLHPEAVLVEADRHRFRRNGHARHSR